MEGHHQSTQKVSVGTIITSAAVNITPLFSHRNAVVRHESVMRLRNKLEELGKMKGVNQDEKGAHKNES